ncbi:sensor histidine kinase [Sphaerisporangium fuscum]|uniref:sensor histidine kinase n=1 Tax=Sphaerisporangium fuscum TaxID=2835868 RepID=UPI001BDCC66B|nr:histidine kinase [Sphaerisporangium fuscum]
MAAFITFRRHFGTIPRVDVRRRLAAIPRVDLMIGGTVVGLGTMQALTSATAYGAAQDPELWWVLQALVTGVLLFYRRRSPVAVFILMILAQYAWHRQGNESCPVWQLAALLIVFHTVGAELRFGPGAAWALSGVLVFDSGAVDLRPLPFEEITFLTVAFGGAYLTGLAVRTHLTRAVRLAEHARLLELEREHRAAEAVAAERTRIARELHDVVAHSVSMMVMQAGALRRAQGGTNEVLSGIERMGREAVDELRVMLGALRMQQDEALPQPGLDVLENLVATLPGADIHLTVRGRPVRLTPGLDLSAYRIVQEALTNAVKHAPGAEIRITIDHLPGAVELEIVNQAARGGGRRAAELSTGHGLVGMRERAELYGGSLEAGPLPAPGQGFRVRARLPIPQGVLV